MVKINLKIGIVSENSKLELISENSTIYPVKFSEIFKSSFYMINSDFKKYGINNTADIILLQNALAKDIEKSRKRLKDSEMYFNTEKLEMLDFLTSAIKILEKDEEIFQKGFSTYEEEFITNLLINNITQYSRIYDSSSSIKTVDINIIISDYYYYFRGIKI